MTDTLLPALNMKASTCSKPTQRETWTGSIPTVETAATLAIAFGEPTEADQQVREVAKEIFRRNFLMFELMGGTLGLVYFGLMLSLLGRREVKEDVERKPPRDLMDWEHLYSQKRFSGGDS